MLYILAIFFLFIIRCRFPKSKSVAEIIRSRYGNHVLKSTRKFEKLDYRIRKVTLDIVFLKTCVENDVIPTFLKFKVSSSRLHGSRAYAECQKKLLFDEMSFKVGHLEKLNRDLEQLGDDLNHVISYFDMTHIINLSTKCNIDAIKEVGRIQNFKLLELIREQSQHNPSDVIRIAEGMAEEKMAKEKLAEENLATENLATENLATEKLATEKLATEKLATEKLAKEKLAKENLSKICKICPNKK